MLTRRDLVVALATASIMATVPLRAEPLPGLRLLPMDEWMIKPCGSGHVALGAWEATQFSPHGGRGCRVFAKLAA